MKLNKPKIVIINLESFSKCTEKIYFKILQNEYRNFLKYDCLFINMGNALTLNAQKFYLETKTIKNIFGIIFIKDNDLNEKSNVGIVKKETLKKETLKISKQIFGRNKKVLVETWGIPNQKWSFDHFLLMHYSHEIFLKNNKFPTRFLKKNLNENYKGNENSIKKIFISNPTWHINLKNNSEFDENYQQLVKLLFV